MRPLQLRTPARLHFGLIELRATEAGAFAGFGCMVDSPSFLLEVEPATGWNVTAEPRWQDRVLDAARRWCEYRRIPALPDVRLSVRHAIEPHVGLGSGTQLALGVVTLLEAFQSANLRDWAQSIEFPARRVWCDRFSASELASCLAAIGGRGRRSLIGTSGFLNGGWLVDEGKGSPNVPLDLHPSKDWSFGLIRMQDRDPISGERESVYLDTWTRQNPHRESMERLLRQSLIPSLERGRFDEFACMLTEYGRLAGSQFEAIQGGCYRSREVEQLAHRILGEGFPGVAQSSWGPTLAVMLASKEHATRLRCILGDSFPELARDIVNLSKTGATLGPVVARQELGNA